MKREIYFVQFLFIALLCLQFAIWNQIKGSKTQWLNVPDTPSRFAASATGFGDDQFAFRYYALMLQNMGDIGGQTSALMDYDYDKLTQWFFLENELDNRSNAIPFLAAYYFGGIQDEKAYKIRPLIEYLEYVGNSPEGEKWRWLAQAAFLAQYKLQDMNWALSIAEKLSALNKAGLPIWAKQMPLIILEKKGEKQTALDMAMNVLQTEADQMQPNEVLFLLNHICKNLLSPSEAMVHPLCAHKRL